MKVAGLLLRTPSLRDMPILVALRNDARANEFTIRTSVDPEEFEKKVLGSLESDSNFFCVAESQGQIVGMGWLDVVDAAGQLGKPSATEGVIGYMIAQEHWGNGFATKLAAGLIDAAFNKLSLRRVTATCFADNFGSIRVLEKVGMRLEQKGIRNSWHQRLGWLDQSTYALLSDEEHLRL